MITHKFHEVTAFADDVTVLRKGKLTGTGKVARARPQGDGGDDDRRPADRRRSTAARRVQSERPVDAGGEVAQGAGPHRPEDRSTSTRSTCTSGEIVGIAGISGNGQKELLEVLAGQRQRDAGEIMVKGAPYGATPRRSPRRSTCASFRRSRCAMPARRRMTVAENMAFRTFDLDAHGQAGELDQHAGAITAFAAAPGRAVQGQDRLARLADRSRCRAAMCSAPCWRAS